MRKWHRVLVVAGTLGSLSLLVGPPAHGGPDELKPGEVRVLAEVVDSSSELDVAVTPDGRRYVADVIFGPLRMIDATGGLTTVESELFTRDNPPRAIAAGPDGALYVRADNGLWRMSPDGTSTLIGGGEGKRTVGPDDLDRGTAPALEVDLAGMGGIAIDTNGVVYLADRFTGRIMTIDAGGTLSIIAGAGELRDGAADGAPAIEAELRHPTDVAVDSRGLVYFVEDGDGDLPSVVRLINPDGTLSTVLGRNPPGYSGDGGPVDRARISLRGEQIALDGADNLYLADLGNEHFRKIDTSGVITTIGPPLLGEVRYDLTIGPDGELYVAGGREIAVVSPRAGQVDVAGEAVPADPWLDDEPGTRHTITTSGPEDPTAIAADPTGKTHVVSAGHLSIVDIRGALSEPPDDGHSTAMTGGGYENTLAVGADGSTYGVSGTSHTVVVRRYPDGAMAVVAGGGQGTEPADPKVRATAVGLGVARITTDHSGRLYVTSGVEGGLRGVFQLADGFLKPMRFPSSLEPDLILDLAVANDGSMHVVDGSNSLYRINPDGTIAGKDRYQGASELEIAGDGTRFVVSETGVHQRDPDGEQHRIVEGTVSAIALDVHGNLHVAEPNGRIQVIVRPGDVGDATAGFPWRWAIVAGAVLLLAGVVLGVPRYRRRIRSVLRHSKTTHTAAEAGDQEPG